MTTLSELKKEFDGPTAPLSEIAGKYLGINSRKAYHQAKAGTLPVPCYRLGSQKSPWLVSLVDLAALIDRKYSESRTDWENKQA